MDDIGDQSFTHVLGAIHEVFLAERTADVAPGRAPLPSPTLTADNVKGYCSFLDADLVGIAHLEPGHWSGEPISGHTNAIAILVGRGRRVGHDEPG